MRKKILNILLIGIILLGAIFTLSGCENVEENFNYESSESKNDKLELQEYVGQWYDEDKLDDLKIKSINNNEINFDLGIFRITTFNNLKAIYNENSKIAEFNTNDTDMGDFWKGVYGTIKFEENQIILEITKSECEYITPSIYVFNIR